jgi:hypothetical protein
MKTVSRINDVTRNGVQKSTKCGIVVNAKAFDMLARQYSDPIKAILQELGANAADSHIRAGKQEVPFSVKLPNALDPHLRIRDYGVGMTEDVVYDVYINYMKSDKTDTNSETGCFGIGSKTPLAYADQFNITTYNDGTMTMYALVKSEDGVPELNEFGSWDTEEDNGVEISFSVKEDDFDKFSERAVQVYKYFNTRPEVTGNGSFAYPERKDIISGDTWRISKGSYSDNTVVVMGNVAYPVDIWQFEYDSKERGFLNNNAVIQVPIGDLNVTPSREALEYNEHTLKGISKAIDRVMSEIADSIGVRFSKADSWWQAKAIQREIVHEIRGIGSIEELSVFNGRSLNEYPELYVRRTFTKDGSKVKASNYEYKKRIEVRSDVRVVIQDTETRFDKNCRYLCGSEDVTVYLVHSGTQEGNPMTLEQIKEELGVCDDDNVVCYSSELKDAPKATGTNKGNKGYTRKTTTTVRKFSASGGGSTHRFEGRYWPEDEVDIKDDSENMLYVNWFNYETTLDNGQSIDVKRLHGYFEDMGITMPTVYGMKENQIKRVAKKDNWMSLEQWATKAFEVYMEENNATELIRLKSLKDEVSWVAEFASLLTKLQLTISEHCLLGELMAFVGADKSTKSAEKILAMARMLKYDVDSADDNDSSEVAELAQKCEEKYSFVIHWVNRNYIHGTEPTVVQNLIQMVESLDCCN